MQPQGIHELKTLFSFKNDKWAYFSDIHDESGLPKISGSGPVPGMAAGTGTGGGTGGGGGVGEGGVSKSNGGVIGGDDRDMTMTTTVDLDAASYCSSLATTHPTTNNNTTTTNNNNNNSSNVNNSEMSLSDPNSSTNQQPIYFPAHTSPLPSPASTRPNSTRNRVYSLSSTFQHPSHTHPTSPTDPTRINTGRSSNTAGMCIY